MLYIFKEENRNIVLVINNLFTREELTIVVWLFLVSSCSFSTGGLETAGNLEGIVDPPLESSECADHDNSGTESVPESVETDLSVDALDLLHNGGVGGTLIQNGDHGISGVRNNGAEDTSPVTRHKSDGKLGCLGVGVLRGGEDVFVESLDGLFEGGELDHGVGDLSHP